MLWKNGPPLFHFQISNPIQTVNEQIEDKGIRYYCHRLVLPVLQTKQLLAHYVCQVFVKIGKLFEQSYERQ